jgi:hypothetical protein
MNRIYHHWEKWECYRAGFWNTVPPGQLSTDDAKRIYAEFLSDLPRFENALCRVLIEWKHSCDQFLSNDNINRTAWLGQASLCIETRIPSKFRGGFRLLTIDQQRAANETAEKWFDVWVRMKESETT